MHFVLHLHLLQPPYDINVRFLFLLIVVLNLALFAFGQGVFGQPPSNEGRSTRVMFERNAEALELGEPAYDMPEASSPSCSSSQST